MLDHRTVNESSKPSSLCQYKVAALPACSSGTDYTNWKKSSIQQLILKLQIKFLTLTFCKRHFSNTPPDVPPPTPTDQRLVFPRRCPRSGIAPYCSPYPNYQFLGAELWDDCPARAAPSIVTARRFLSAARLNHFHEAPTKNFATRNHTTSFMVDLTIWRFFRFFISGGRYSKSLSLRYKALKVSKTQLCYYKFFNENDVFRTHHKEIAWKCFFAQIIVGQIKDFQDRESTESSR